MPRIRAIETIGGHAASIDVDGVVVGGIEMTGPGTYTVDTKGKVPAIDGLTGQSPIDAWAGVVREVQAGKVTYVSAPVHIGPYEVE
jgi:hypothetical protein